MGTAQTAAVKLIKELRLSPPIDLHKVAKSLGAEIYYKLMPAGFDGWVVELNPDFTKFFTTAEYIIMVNSRRLKVRQRFTIAHEIGHIVLEHPEKKSKLLYKHSKITAEDDYKFEREADLFASELLIPTSHLLTLAKMGNPMDIEKLSAFYQVSREAMKIKLEKIEKIIQNARLSKLT